MERKLDRELYPEYVYPEHKASDNGPPRESILKLGKMITDRIPQKLGLKKITKDDPEYWGLAGGLTDGGGGGCFLYTSGAAGEKRGGGDEGGAGV